MNKVEIKKAVGLVQRELTKYGLMTPGNGIDFPVSISVGLVENERGNKTPHIHAYWLETLQVDFNEYKLEETSKVEELNGYFDAEVFVHGITQRAKWIQADHSDRVAYLEENPGGHPALFPVWMEAQNIVA